MSSELPKPRPVFASPRAGAAPAPLQAPAPTRRAGAPVCIDSAQLFGSATEVQISHRGALYRLTQTALGKLILTK
jgi:hemin uptake protein HemP